MLALRPRIVRGRRGARGTDQRGVAADPRQFEDEYRSAIAAVLAEAKLEAPADQRPILGGRRGHHSEHLGHLLAVMQYLPRTYPDANGRLMAEHFYTFRVAEIVPETDEANSIRFEVPDELRESFASGRGSICRCAPTSAAKRCGAIIRYASRPMRATQGHGQADRRRRFFELGRRQSQGRRHDRRDGAARLASPSISIAAKKRRYVGFAGGSGITPVMSLIKTALKHEPDSRFTLFYGNRD